jgi:transposase-like protein
MHPVPPIQVLEEAYKTKSLAEMGILFGVTSGTVWRWMRNARLALRPSRQRVPGKLPKPPVKGSFYSAEWLRDQYLVKGMTIRDISAAAGVGYNTVIAWLKRHEIKARTASEASKLSKKNTGKFAKGDKHRLFKGGRFVNWRGYVEIRIESSVAGKSIYVLEHRHVMATHLGRALTKKEIVHHINGVKTDNRLENLRLLRPDQHSPVLHITEQLEAVKEELRLLKEHNDSLQKALEACRCKGVI